MPTTGRTTGPTTARATEPATHAATAPAAATDRGNAAVPDERPLRRGGLTSRQRAILQLIRDAVDERGYPPSVREICEHVGLTSTSSVAHQLRMLEAKGYLRRDPHRPRALEVLLTPEGNATERNRQHGRTDSDRHEHVPADQPAPEPVYLPVVGRVAAGTPILAEENVEDVFPLPRELVGNGRLFLLRVRGDSMLAAGILDRDWVAVRQQQSAENGEIVVALLDGEATVKTFKRRGEHAWLLPQNPAYEPIPADEASIVGKVVAVVRAL
jgi:repressor LexA